MDKGEHVQRMAINMLVNAGYNIDFTDADAVIKALSDYEEKHDAMLEHILLQHDD